MGLLGRIFSKPLLARMMPAVEEAVHSLNGVLPDADQGRITGEMVEIGKPIFMPKHETTNQLSVELALSAMAAAWGLYIWDSFHTRYSESELSLIARCCTTLQLFGIYQDVGGKGPIAQIVGETVAGRHLDEMAIRPVTMCSSGRESEGRKFVADAISTANAPPDIQELAASRVKKIHSERR